MAILIEKEKVELLTNLSLVYVLFILYNCKKKKSLKVVNCSPGLETVFTRKVTLFSVAC